MKRFFVMAGCCLALCLAGSRAHAQTGAVRGKVVDDKGQPVADAKITIDFKGGVNRTFNTKTNKRGEYAQVGLAPGNYRITASKEGFQSVYSENHVGLGDPTEVPDIKLVPPQAAAGGGAGGGGGEELQAAFKKAVELTDAGKLDEAEAAYKDILTKHPTIAQVHYNLGYVYMQKKDWPSAEAAYKKALEIKPDFSDASIALAKVYQESGQKDKAMETMAAGGSDPKVLFNLGIMNLNAGKYDEAEAAFNKVMELDPNNAEVHFHMGTIALNKGKADEAIAHLEKYLSMSPQNAQNVSTAQQLVQALKPKK
jgi:tetratricopeptide (TPR) repeat protein